MRKRALVLNHVLLCRTNSTTHIVQSVLFKHWTLQFPYCDFTQKSSRATEQVSLVIFICKMTQTHQWNFGGRLCKCSPSPGRSWFGSGTRVWRAEHWNQLLLLVPFHPGTAAFLSTHGSVCPLSATCVHKHACGTQTSTHQHTQGKIPRITFKIVMLFMLCEI